LTSRFSRSASKLSCVCASCGTHSSAGNSRERAESFSIACHSSANWCAQRPAAIAIARATRIGAQRQHGHGHCLLTAPWPLARLQRPEDAAQLIGFAERFWHARIGALQPKNARHVERVRRLVRAQIGPVRTEALWAEGAALPLARVVELALVVPPVPPSHGAVTPRPGGSSARVANGGLTVR
jgi:hypothetical protein